MAEVKSKFSEVSALLDKNLADVIAKKKVMDDAGSALTKAGEEYQKAVDTGQNLKQQLITILNESYPAEIKGKIG